MANVGERRLELVALPSASTSASGEEMGDAALVDGLRQRDARAARELHARFGPRINRLVWRLLGPDQEHNDVVHQVYLNILDSITRLRSPTDLGAWIAGVAVNTVRREIRSRTYRRIFGLAPEPALELPDHVGTDARVIATRFYAVLRRMKADERIIFVLHFMEGYSLPAVASLGGFSLSTAKRRLIRARATFEAAALGDAILASVVEGRHAQT